MNEVLFHADIFGRVWTVTPWKLAGYLGVACFSGRWIIQVIASHKAGRSHLPRVFWYMSLAGSLVLLSYFTFSNKSDSVGILSNLFPSSIAVYNLILLRRKDREASAVSPARGADRGRPANTA
jgi:lipid-A-disaccharide synthase-like uncharacterized protein